MTLQSIISIKIRPETFQHVTSWLNDAKGTARNECSICIVGNKNDLKDARVIKYNDGAKFCQENSKFLFKYYHVIKIIKYVNVKTIFQ